MQAERTIADLEIRGNLSIREGSLRARTRASTRDRSFAGHEHDLRATGHVNAMRCSGIIAPLKLAAEPS